MSKLEVKTYFEVTNKINIYNGKKKNAIRPKSQLVMLISIKSKLECELKRIIKKKIGVILNTRINRVTREKMYRKHFFFF